MALKLPPSISDNERQRRRWARWRLLMNAKGGGPLLYYPGPFTAQENKGDVDDADAGEIDFSLQLTVDKDTSTSGTFELVQKKASIFNNSAGYVIYISNNQLVMEFADGSATVQPLSPPSLPIGQYAVGFSINRTTNEIKCYDNDSLYDTLDASSLGDMDNSNNLLFNVDGQWDVSEVKIWHAVVPTH